MPRSPTCARAWRARAAGRAAARAVVHRHQPRVHEELVAYWRERLRLARAGGELNRFPQFTVPLGGIDLHFIHEPGAGPAPMPLLLSHGWPGSVFEFPH